MAAHEQEAHLTALGKAAGDLDAALDMMLCSLPLKEHGMLLLKPRSSRFSCTKLMRTSVRIAALMPVLKTPLLALLNWEPSGKDCGI
jgi:hypothetical protein